MVSGCERRSGRPDYIWVVWALSRPRGGHVPAARQGCISARRAPQPLQQAQVLYGAVHTPRVELTMRIRVITQLPPVDD